MKQTNDPLYFSCVAGVAKMDHKQWRIISDACYSASLAYDEAVRDLAGVHASSTVTTTLFGAVSIQLDPFEIHAAAFDRWGMIKPIEVDGRGPFIETDVRIECNGGDPTLRIRIPDYEWWKPVDWIQCRMFFENFDVMVRQINKANFLTIALDQGQTIALCVGPNSRDSAIELCRHLLATHGDRAFIAFDGGDDDLDSDFIDELYEESEQ